MENYRVEITSDPKNNKGLKVSLFKNNLEIQDYFNLLVYINKPTLVDNLEEDLEDLYAELVEYQDLKPIRLVINMENPALSDSVDKQLHINSEDDGIEVSLLGTKFDFKVSSDDNKYELPLGIAYFWLSYSAGSDSAMFSFESGIQDLKQYIKR